MKRILASLGIAALLIGGSTTVANAHGCEGRLCGTGNLRQQCLGGKVFHLAYWGKEVQRWTISKGYWSTYAYFPYSVGTVHTHKVWCPTQ